jgi:hypothetical protein
LAGTVYGKQYTIPSRKIRTQGRERGCFVRDERQEWKRKRGERRNV